MNRTASDSAAGAAPCESVFVEAAAWVVRLHGPSRSAEVESGLRRWLAQDQSHRLAFEIATETWNSTGNIEQHPTGPLRQWIQTRPGVGTALAAAAGAAAVAILFGLMSWFQAPQMQTQVGEQRTMRLADGTLVSLNTNTELAVHYDDQTRNIVLARGEALFEVAKQPGRPFIVTAGERTIEALGTSFVVRHEARKLAVTLLEGKVAVSSALAAKEGREGKDSRAVLAPGERAVFVESLPAKLDQPNLEKLTAWQRGLVMLDNTPLAEAIAEMNRYSAVKLTLEQNQVGTFGVSGVFRAGDSMRFAQAVAKTYQLVVIEKPDRIVLAGAGVI